MDTVILVIHLILALAIIGLVLLQRSEGGGLGIGGGGGGGIGGLSTPQGTANFLSRATAIAAGLFFCTSLILGVMAGKQSGSSESILEELNQRSAIEADAPAAEEMVAPADVSAPVEKIEKKEPPRVPLAE
ncbi:MAG: preprotein translocase subunit SecG [Micavibrio sp.]|nr:preprotein translocase subunit SecG [Micavibrio sp.]